MKKIVDKIWGLIIILLLTQGMANAYEFNTKLSPNETVYKSASTRINIIDPTVQNNQNGGIYPGFRGANQLVIYTPEYGRRTGTNEFGTEAVVVNGYVTSLSGADSIIPYNGFVISGHGTAKNWISKNVTLGSKIVVNPDYMVITSALTPESMLFAANEKIKEVFSIMKYYSHQNIPYDYTNSVEYLKKSKKALSQATKQIDNVQKYSNTAIENADKAIEYAIPYNKAEMKGIWIRPTEKTKEEIIKTLDKLKASGIDTVFLETYYHAKTIYPSEVLSKYKITNQRQEFRGFDPFQIWIDEAHKRNMKVHAWFECFYVGNDNPLYNPNHILSVYPQWGNVTKANYNSEKPVLSPVEHNGYFLDPANPIVQTYLLEVINELVSKYNPDGINLDYIRYPQTVVKSSPNYEANSWGYTQYARDEFLSIYDVDPINIQKNSQEWDWWDKYRQEKVSNFVQQVSDLIRPKTQLTAVIFPDRKKSLDTKMQDWKTWSFKGYVDGFTPLLLSCDYETAKSLLHEIKSNSSKSTDIYAGIFVSFMKGTTDDMLRQIHMTRELKAKGVIIFEYSHFTKPYIDAVTASAFTPLSDKSLRRIKSAEVSPKKLQAYLDKSIKEFYQEERLFNQALSKKQQPQAAVEIKNPEQKKEETTALKETSNVVETAPNNVNKTEKSRKKKKRFVKFAPDKQQGNKGRFY